MSDSVLEVRRVSKKFFLSKESAYRPKLAAIARSFLGIKLDEKIGADEFWALKDITLELKRGEALGIVGLNGAGKSTLLKILLGRLTPDGGSVHISGDAGGLIELGAGFHPEHTGRKNIEINSKILGVTKSEFQSKLNKIIEFAELGKFIDMPVNTYSSGMAIRLGFSIAIHFLKDLIICDEILAVGDFEFRQKCLQRIKEIRKTRSIILVSHGSRDISMFCNKAMLLHRGECIIIDSPEKVLKAYSLCNSHISADELRFRLDQEFNSGERTDGNADLSAVSHGSETLREAREETSTVSSEVTKNEDLDSETRSMLHWPEYSNDEILDEISVLWNVKEDETGCYLQSGDAFRIEVSFRLKKIVDSLRIGLPFFNLEGNMLLGPDSRSSKSIGDLTQPNYYTVKMEVESLPIVQGRFWPVLAINDDPAHLYRKHLPFIDIRNSNAEFGVFRLHTKWNLGANAAKGMRKVF
ncbi:MAG: polysaccharide ABC transporter ATP-binding protein [Opitutaceae bacterium]|nr:polysaccharide ABC transporter ATP-binding protein [Opitutaceae bacterium]